MKFKVGDILKRDVGTNPFNERLRLRVISNQNEEYEFSAIVIESKDYTYNVGYESNKWNPEVFEIDKEYMLKQEFNKDLKELIDG